MSYIPFLIFTVLANAGAQLLLKQGMITFDGNAFDAGGLLMKVVAVLFNPWVFAGLVTYVLAMGSHLYVLSKVDVSFAYPFLSLAYVPAAILAYFLFKEDLNAWRVWGILLICVGTAFMAQSGHKDPREIVGYSDRGEPGISKVDT
ncbi:EamA family transporter [Hoeflea prorocentri]|uniref:EamA family transporter n=1 Tax=Hoeflea prorocentri TaxID=1922333 RepID=A0A9X3UJP8_9HYPH|nr:EamA family transporter [Hoeflea prorocentri]MCY6380031.1 EamA family transporter [Hoeflea prorocentri]MDA5397831.1 EamA family transporter [Hoeflea prorocentri]